MKPKPLHILLVDDHALAREGLRAAIRASFPTALVAEAGNASEALASMSARQPDLVLLDVNLPGESGIQLARRIRAAHKRVRFLMVAGEADPWTVKEAIDSGASGFITKTRSAAFLGQTLRKILKGQTVLCPDAEAALQQSGRHGGAEFQPPGPLILSEREREVLKYLARGENTKSIASSLQISAKTVETHRQHIMRKLGIDSVAGLTRYAIRHGLCRP